MEVKVIKIHRSIYVPQTDVEEIEDIISGRKKMSFNKAMNEGIQLWLKQNRKLIKGESK